MVAGSSPVSAMRRSGVILRYAGVAVFPAEIIKMLALVGFNLIMNKDGSISAGNRKCRHSSMVEQQKPVCRTFDSSWRLKYKTEVQFDMPTKDQPVRCVWIEYDDEPHELTEVKEVELTSYIDVMKESIDALRRFARSGIVACEVFNNFFAVSRKFLRTAMPNNWLKMHKIAMRRKKM